MTNRELTDPVAPGATKIPVLALAAVHEAFQVGLAEAASQAGGAIRLTGKQFRACWARAEKTATDLGVHDLIDWSDLPAE